MGLEPTTSSLGRRPVYGIGMRNSAVLERVAASAPGVENGESGSENGFGGPSVDPTHRRLNVYVESRMNRELGPA
jgi:hypothetical protein